MTRASRPAGRVLALDVGGRRTGLALSDPTGTLATPLGVITSRAPLTEIVGTIDRLRQDPDGLAAVVMGRPVRLDGSPTDQTSRVDALAAALRARIGLPLILRDERLTSVEAESRLALREKDWRVRKARLDAAAAAIILQDFLDDGPS